jgi:hypothetical protein
MTLILKRAAASRLWHDDDFDVLADGAVVGPAYRLRRATSASNTTRSISRPRGVRARESEMPARTELPLRMRPV